MVNKIRVSSSKDGIIVDHMQQKICLDPRREIDCDYIFVSHAHLDHLHKTKFKPKSSRSNVIASAATSKIAYTRGYTLGELCNNHNFELLDSGHILGSKGLLIEDELYYTGDISTRKRAFMKPARIPKAKILIIESTFGREEYIFPKIEAVMHEANILISEMYDQGRPVVLLGYPLGKAQLLTQLFNQWDPLFVEDSVLEMNRLCSRLGARISVHGAYSLAEENGLLSPRKPWILIAPLNSCKNGLLDRIKRKYAPITIGFSGWAIKPNFKHFLGLDYCFPFSDHCDYGELIKVVETCGPERIYTFHGFDADFANSLRSLGFDATPVPNGKKCEDSDIKSNLLTNWC